MFDFSVLQRDALPCSSGQDSIEIRQRSKDAETLDMPCIVAKKGGSQTRDSQTRFRTLGTCKQTMCIFYRAIPRGHPGV